MSNRRTAILLGILGVLLLIGIPLTVYLVNSSKPQEIRSRAQEGPTPTNAACPAPGPVLNVKVEYPSCSGNQCQFDQASCSWTAVTGAASYTIKVTQVDTNTVVRSDSVNASTTRITFPIINNNTYKCDVTAMNSCGSSGGTGSDSLLCKTDGLFPTNTPAPTPVPTTIPTPTTPIGAPPTTPPYLVCGAVSCSPTTPCQAGLICTTANNGLSYCSMPAFQSACKVTPGFGSCCQAQAVPTATPSATLIPSPTPTRIPTRVPVSPPGDGSTAVAAGAGGLAAILIGGILFVLLGL